MRALLLLLAGCGVDAEPEAPPSWYGDVDRIVADHCAACHLEGGAAPFRLDRYEDAVTFAEAALAAVEGGTMPPWPPDPDCRHYVGENLLTEAEVETLRGWIDAGTPEGAEADAAEMPAPPPPIDPTASARVPGYVTPEDAPDDYRCFVLDMDFEQTQYLTAYQVVPSSPQVHHVLVYGMAAAFADRVRAADEADEGPGYTCFGGPLPSSGSSATAGFEDGFPIQIGAWVPGLAPSLFPEGVGIRIPAGTIPIIQIHYSAQGGAPEPDETEYRMVLTDEEPTTLLRTVPVGVLELYIPANKAEVPQSRTYTNYADDPVQIRSAAAHMHLLGSAQDSKIIHNDGTEECLLEIPDWDFNWQMVYSMLEDEPAIVAPGESVELTCHYDNSPENQPIVDGEPQTPRDVYWGDGTLDEMCLLYLTRIEPFTPAPPPDAPVCWGIEACLADCESSDAECLSDCESTSAECGLCVLEEAVDCLIPKCPVQLLMAEDCLWDCAINSFLMDGTVAACARDRCPTEWEGLMACADPVVVAGQCDADLKKCGVER